MPDKALQKELEHEKAARQAADAEITVLKEEIKALKKNRMPAPSASHPPVDTAMLVAGIAAGMANDGNWELFTRLLEGLPLDIAIFSTDHRYLFVNTRAVSDPELRKWIIGKSEEEYCRHMGRPLAVADGRRKMFNNVKSTGKHAEWEEKVKKADGTIIYHLRKMFPVADNEGNVVMVIGCGTDMTGLKRTEDSLKLSERRYKEIFSFSQAWICTHDMEGILLTINPAACTILGYAEQELVGVPIDTLMPPAVRPQFNEIYLADIKKKGRSEGVLNILNRAGRNMYLLYHNYLVSEPGITPYIIGFAQNITERLQAENALKQSEERYRGIIENMNLGMLELDMNEHIIYANQRFCTMSGYPRSELLTRNARKMLLDNGHKKAMSDKALDRQFTSANSYELNINTKNGEAKWWLVSNAPLYNEDGSVKGSVSIHLDITRQKRMEQQLRDAKLEAERSSDAKEMFLTNMSHEIRTPINAIMGLGKLLGKSELDEQQKYYLSSIRTASENLLVIINDILDLSKIEAGKIALEQMPFDLKKIMSQSANMLTHKAEEKGLVLSQQIDPRIAPKLIGDPFRINQVLMNMLSNAIKFTEKGSVDLRAALTNDDNAFQTILITIRDTGVGISEAFIDNIFKKFTQEDETVARKFGGTGLGMSITRQLMELMGGSINITSRKDAGTTISLQFRFKIGSEKVFEKKRAISKSDTGNIKGKKILLVEDNELNRLLAFTILKQYGALVSVAENGAVAVDLMRNEKYDIILMDVQMPVMDGITATQIIRKEINATIPIIALTANAIKGKEEQYIQAGMNDCITKPYDEDKMIGLLSIWISNSATAPFDTQEPIAAEVTVTPAADDEPYYNMAKLLEIGAGNHDFIMQMLRLFVTDIPLSAHKIKDAYDKGDYDTMKYLAHRIRPSLHNMSVNRIKDEVLQIEKLAEKGEKSLALERMINNMLRVIEKVVDGLKSEYNM